jgi:hypothetical protein
LGPVVSLSVETRSLGQMKPYDQNIVTFEAMFVGYTEALDRLEEAALGRNPAATYVPLFEALNWAHALDERIAAHWVPDGPGKPVRWGWRERIPNAEIMAGVRYARNSVHHDWSDAVVLRDGGVSFPLTFPLSFSSGLSGSSRGWEWVWRDAEELPRPGKEPHADSERIYREQMRGRSVKATLDVLGGVFLTLQRLLEPHTIRNVPWPDDEYPFPFVEQGIVPDQ